jgi:voltage-dependent potassium channel beta subunit
VNYRAMGKTGLKLSEISLGAWITFGDQIDEQAASQLLHRAYDQGINFFDNADVYADGQAELVMGRAISDLPRPALVISSKVFWPTFPGVNGRGLSRKHIFESCHASLKRLGVDYLDLYFCHRHDPETPLEEVIRAMDDLVHQGKVLYWGTSEWRAAQLSSAHALAREMGCYAPMVEQPQYNLFERERVEVELAPAADKLGFGLVTWSPLRYGLLSGKYNQGLPDGTRLSRDQVWAKEILTEPHLRVTRQLSQVAVELGVSLPQLAIGWLLNVRQVTSVITGASKAAHLEDNLGASRVVRLLTPEVVGRVESILGAGEPHDD